MRFRKSITIFKGVKLNFSKSGVSVTIGGGKGLSANVGEKGVFLNTSIPGTGLYDRKKLISFGEKSKSSNTKSSEEAMPAQARMDEFNALTEAFVNIGQLSAELPKHGQAARRDSRDAVEDRIEAWLNALELPIDFHVDYEYDDETGVLMADMDLPEIEHLPTRQLVMLSSGKLKEKDKSQKELKQEYARCVFGLGMFCASWFFTASAQMERVALSAYTQRRDAKTGEPQDTYIYSVVYEREAFEKAGYQQADPETFACRFKNRMNKTATGDLKPIVPYGPADL